MKLRYVMSGLWDFMATSAFFFFDWCVSDPIVIHIQVLVADSDIMDSLMRKVFVFLVLNNQSECLYYNKTCIQVPNPLFFSVDAGFWRII